MKRYDEAFKPTQTTKKTELFDSKRTKGARCHDSKDNLASVVVAGATGLPRVTDTTKKVFRVSQIPRNDL